MAVCTTLKRLDQMNTRTITLNPQFVGTRLLYDFKNDWVVIKDGNTLYEFSAPRREDDYRGFTEEQRKVIRTVNYVLEHNKQPLMTDAEAEKLIFPFGRELETKIDQIQALAGFRVEKEIVYNER